MSGRVYVLILLLAALVLTSACAGHTRRTSLAPPPPTLHAAAPVAATEPGLKPLPMNTLTAALAGTRGVPPASYERHYPAAAPRAHVKPVKCSLKDRFDRDDDLAYDFGDGKRRIGLDIDTENMVEVRGFMVEFRYKFQPSTNAKEKCRYKSSLQGKIGSAYNELFQREEETIWRELKDEGLDFWN